MTTFIPQIWEMSRDYPARLGDDEALGITHLNIKVADGPRWQGAFDQHPLAITSAMTWKQRIQDYAARGIIATPWIVPTWTGNHDEELRIASQVLEISNSLVYNVEFWNDPYFWQGGKEGVIPYIGELRRRFPLAQFTLQYDVRHPDSIHLHEWLPYMDKVISMSYWTDFKQTPWVALSNAYVKMKALNRPFSYTYPGNAESYPDWQIDEDPIYIFRRGNLSPACIQMIQAARTKEEDKEEEEEKKVDEKLESTDDINQRITDLYNEQVRQAVIQEEFMQKLVSIEDRMIGSAESLKKAGSILGS